MHVCVCVRVVVWIIIILPIRMRKEVNAQRMAAKRARDKTAREGPPMSDNTTEDDDHTDDQKTSEDDDQSDEQPTPKTTKNHRNTRYVDCANKHTVVYVRFLSHLSTELCLL